MSKFVNLHCHTEYSILDSIITTAELFSKVKELNQEAVAITDHGTLAGLWSGLKASKEAGVKLIAGCEFYFHSNINGFKEKSSKEKIRHIILISKNLEGYRNLLSINKSGFDNAAIFGKKVIPLIDWDCLDKYKNGLICLTASGNGIIGQSINFKDFDKAEADLLKLKDIFGDSLGAEIQANNLVRFGNNFLTPINQNFTNYHIKRLAEKNNIKIVPTSNAHYLTKNDAETHDVFLAIGSMQPTYSNSRLKYISSPEFYLKTEEEIKEFFSRNYGSNFADLIIDNSAYFASLCEKPDWIDPKFTNPSGKELPVFPIKGEPDYEHFINWREKRHPNLKKLDDDQLFLRFRCLKEFDKKVPTNQRKTYMLRLEEELDTLYYCGVASYTLIVSDYINWARKNGISVGPGRGSVGGSLVAYLLGIHQADPIKYGLVFERFHNKLKKNFSDIDQDISKSGREKVLQYIENKYGSDNFAAISNFVGVKPKVYVKDVARALELGGGRKQAVDLGMSVAEFIPKDEKNVGSMSEILKISPMFNEYCKKYPEFIKHEKILNKNRNLSIHASGIVISERPLASFVSLRKDSTNKQSIELDKDMAEEAGLVKMDILGLNTLDIIDRANELINQHNKAIPLINYDNYDKDTYDLISRGDTFCVFQFGESAGTMDLCKKVVPKNIEDLAIITTLARPASKEIRSDFIKVRNKEKKVQLLHPSLRNALSNTLGYPLYDESLLILAKDVAGWDLGEADKLRKLTKEKGKNPKKVIKWRDDFISGAIKNKIQPNDAINIWDNIIEPYGRYSFNKSHAILYSMISYTTAYLKAHFPLEFLLANLESTLASGKQDSDKKAERIKHELRMRKIKILPPDINKSEMTYILSGNGTILTGFDALKNVGDDAIQDIISKRPFKSIDDFMDRVDGHKVRSSTVQALAAAGCFDCFGMARKVIYSYCADCKKKAQAFKKKNTDQLYIYPWPKDDDWSLKDKYIFEKHYIGESFSCSKKQAYSSFFDGRYSTLKDIDGLEDKDRLSPLKVEIKEMHQFKVKKVNSKFFGKTMVKILVEDENGVQAGGTIFPDKWADFQKKVKSKYKTKLSLDEGFMISVDAQVNAYEGEKGIIINELYDFVAPLEITENMTTKKEISPKMVDKFVSGSTENSSGTGSLEDRLFDLGFINSDDEL